MHLNILINEDFDFWKTVLFTEQIKCNFFVVTDIKKFGGEKNSEIKPENFAPTVKHHGGGVIILG